VGVLFG